MEIKARLQRSAQPKQTLGKLIFTRNELMLFACDTIELPWLNNAPQISCIPTGKYKVVYRESAKYPRHYHVLNVPNRDFILIHQANYVGSKNPKTHKPDLLGCIGVGNGYGDITGDGVVELLQSGVTLKKILSIIGKESFELEIV